MASLSQLPVETTLHVLNYLGTKDLAAGASTCRWLYALANPLLYKLEAQDPESYTFYAAAGSGNVGRMQKLVDAGFDVNRPWYSSVSAAQLEDEQMMDDWRQGKCSEESFSLYRLTKTKRDAKAAQFRYERPQDAADRIAWEENVSDLEDTLPRVSRGLAAANTAYFWTALHVATANGEDEAASFLIHNRASINAPSRNFCLCRRVNACFFMLWNTGETISPPQWSPLHLAICRGHLSTATLLLRRGASIVVEVDGLSDDASMDENTTPEDGFRCTALHAACFFGMFNLVKTLVEDGYQSEVNIGDRFRQTPLAYAFCAGNFTPFIPYLQSKGSDINATLGCYRYAQSDEYEASPLLTACKARRYRDAIELIKLGADVNAFDEDDNTPLHFCARGFSRGEKDETIQTLLKAGAKVMLRNREGSTPLHYAVESLDTQTAKILIQYGADASVCDPYGNTLVALFWDNLAVFPSERDIKGMMDLLTSHGVDVNARNEKNLTALHLFCCSLSSRNRATSGFCTALKILLSYGADVALRDNFGLLPFHRAFRDGFLKVCRLLFTEQVRSLLTEGDIYDMFLSIFGLDDEYCLTRSFKVLLNSGGGFLLSRPETLKIALDCDADCLIPLLISKETFTEFISNSGDTVLHRGCQSGMFKRESIVVQLLDSDLEFDANIKNKNNETILYEYFATIKQRDWHNLYPTICRLLKRGADPHRLVKQIPPNYHRDYSQCDRPLDIVIYKCQFNMAYEILKKYPVQGDISGYSYLHHSCSFQKAPPCYNLILQLLRHGFDANGISSFGETPLCHMLRTFKPGLPMESPYILLETYDSPPRPYMAVDHVGTLMSCIELLQHYGAKWDTRSKYSLDGRWTAGQELQHLLAYNGEHSPSRRQMHQLRMWLNHLDWDHTGIGENFFLFKEEEEEEAHEVQH